MDLNAKSKTVQLVEENRERITVTLRQAKTPKL